MFFAKRRAFQQSQLEVKTWPIPSKEEIENHEEDVVSFVVKHDVQLEIVAKKEWKTISANLNPNFPTRSVYCMFNIDRKKDPKKDSPFLKLYDKTHQQVEEKIQNSENIFFTNGIRAFENSNSPKIFFFTR